MANTNTPLFNSNVSPVPFMGGPDKAEVYDVLSDGTTTNTLTCAKIRVVEGVLFTGPALTAASWSSDGANPPVVSWTTAAFTSGGHATLVIFGK